MREIKFRVWQANQKEYLYPDTGYQGLLIDTSGQIHEDMGFGEFVQFDRGYTIQQYTGLKDKNGQEIYEGDIVERRRERGLVDFNNNNYGEVLGWNLLLYQYIPYQKEGWIYADKNKDGKLEPIEFYYGCPPDKSWEVIGNIFEGVDK